MQKLMDEFAKGFAVDKGIFDFAQTMGFELEFNELKSVIEDFDHEISQELCSLIFSPDFEIRKRFVPIWIELCMENKVIDLKSFCSKIDGVKLFYENQSMQVYPHKKYIYAFFEKLKINFMGDLELIKECKNLSKEDYTSIAAVLWGNINVFEPDRKKIILTYIENTDFLFPFSKDEFLFFIKILCAWNKEKYNFNIYMAKLVYVYQKAHREAVEAADFLKTNNIETFMVQGGRVPVSNPENLLISKKHLFNIASKLHIPKDIFVEEGADIEMPVF